MPQSPVAETFALYGVGLGTATTHTITMPAGIEAGNGLECAVSVSDGQLVSLSSASTTAGWVKLGQSPTGVNGGLAIFIHRNATPGIALTLTTATAVRVRAVTRRISGALTTENPTISAFTTANDIDPNPGIVTKAGPAVAEDVLVIASLAGNAGYTTYGVPPGYTGLANIDGVSASEDGVASAWRALSTISEDPGLFDIGSAARNWRCAATMWRPDPNAVLKVSTTATPASGFSASSELVGGTPSAIVATSAMPAAGTATSATLVGTTAGASPGEPRDLAGGSTLARPALTASPALSPRGLRDASTLARPALTASASAAPRGLRDASTLARPALAAATNAQPRALHGASALARPAAVAGTSITARDLRSGTTLARPDLVTGGASGAVYFDGVNDYLDNFGFPGNATSAVIEIAFTPTAVSNKTHALTGAGKIDIAILSNGSVEANGGHLNGNYAVSAAGVIVANTPYTLRYEITSGVGATISVNGTTVLSWTSGQINSGDLWLDNFVMFTISGGAANRFDGNVSRVTIQRSGSTVWEINSQPANVWNASPQMVGAVTDVAGGATPAEPRDLRVAPTLQRPPLTAASSLTPRSLSSAPTLQRSALTASAALSVLGLRAASTIHRPQFLGLSWTDIAATNNQALPYTLWGKDWRANVAQTATDLMSWDVDNQVVKAQARFGEVRSGDPSDRYRAELSGSPFPWSASNGDRWISFAQVVLQQPSNATFTTFMQQFDLGFSNPMLKLDDRGPLLQVNIAGDPGTTRTQIAVWEGTRLQTERLYHHVWRVRASGAGSGQLDWWVNGTLVLSLTGIALGSGSSPSAYEKIGAYIDDDATLGLDADAEVILLNYESASGSDALLARVGSPAAVPSQISALYPTGAAPTGTVLIPQTVQPFSLRSATTVSRPPLAAGTSLAPLGLRGAPVVQRPSVAAATTAQPRGLLSTSTAVRPGAVTIAGLVPRSLASGSSVQRASVVASASLAPQSLRTSSAIARPAVTSATSLAPRGLRSAPTIARPTLASEGVAQPLRLMSASRLQSPALTGVASTDARSLRAASSLVRPALAASASLVPQGLRSASTLARPTLASDGVAQPRGLRASPRVQSPALTVVVVLAPRGIRGASILTRPSLAPIAATMPRGLTTGTQVARPTIAANTALAPLGLRDSPTIRSPQLSGSGEALPRGIVSGPRLQRPALAPLADAAPRSVTGASTINRPGLVALPLLAPLGLRAASSIVRPVPLIPPDAGSERTARLRTESRTATLRAEPRTIFPARETRTIAA